MATRTPAVITVTPRGPYLVSGIDRITTAAGDAVPAKPGAALCRCGFSKSKPFCDGAHGPYQFSKAAQPARADGAVMTYQGATVEVRYNPALCAHLGVCTGDLPEVFDTTRRPWVAPDQADAARVIDIVHRCPSGALTAAAPTPDAAAPADIDRGATITALKNGPLAVAGPVELDGIAWADGAPRHRFTLCRCGASKTMPFCDSSHRAVGFTDE